MVQHFSKKLELIIFHQTWLIIVLFNDIFQLYS